MSKDIVLKQIAASLMLLAVAPAIHCGELDFIHSKDLPQETAILAALDDARQMESYSSAWVAQWNFDLTKEEVSTRLTKDLALLSLAQKHHSENAELQLLTGVVAHYAYNLDVHSYDTAINSFVASLKISSKDYRGRWFRANTVCQTPDSQGGGKEFLEIENDMGSSALPVDFWDEYIVCMILTNMPEHALRAGQYISMRHVQSSALREEYLDIARKRYSAFEAAKEYKPSEAFEGRILENKKVEFTSTACGIRYQTQPQWYMEKIGLAGGVCVVALRLQETDEQEKAKTPRIILTVSSALRYKNLEGFVLLNSTSMSMVLEAATFCPTNECISNQGTKEGANHSNKVRFHNVVFERNPPKYPGLIFEQPASFPQSGRENSMYTYSVSQRIARIPGKLNYLVRLESTIENADDAEKSFQDFLKNIIVE